MRRTHWWVGRGTAAAAVLAGLVCLGLPATAAAMPAADASSQSTRLVTLGAGYDKPAGAAPVRALQRRLQVLGHEPGPIDGLYGPLTEAAVERFQLARGLHVDGVVGPVTRRALRQAPSMARGEGYGQRGGSRRVRVLQQRLQRLGHEPGPIDGMYGPLTQAAVMRFQRVSALSPDGVVGPRTRKVLARTRSGAGSASSRVPENGTGGQRDTGQRDTGQTDTRQRDTRQTDTGQRNTRAGAVPPRTQNIPTDDSVDRSRPQTGGWDPGVTLVVGLLALVLTGVACALVAASGRGPRPRSQGKTRSPRFERGTGTSYFASPTPQHEMGQAGERVHAFGYVSLSESQPLMEVSEQSAAILEACDRRGWHVREIVRDIAHAELPAMRRPELGHVLGRLASGEGSCLIVAGLGRLSSSAAELGDVLSWLKEREIRLVAVDVQLDTATPAGRLAVDALISVGALERRRTEGTNHASLESQAEDAAGNRLAVRDVPALKQHIVDMRARGMTLQAIADRLNAEGVPTLRGGQEWRPSSVQAAAGYHRPPQRRKVGHGGLPPRGSHGDR